MKAFESALLIFDLDGTLVDSAGDITLSVNSLLDSLGRPSLSIEAVRSMVGEGARRLVEKVLAARPGAEIAIESALERFLALYAEAPTQHTVLYPGVRETLDQLVESGAVLALCTNKPMIPTTNVLRDLDLSRYFKMVVAGDTLPVRKPDRRVLDGIIATLGVGQKTVLMIGDSEVDSATADAAKIPFVLMTYGYRHSPAELIPANARLDAFADLLLLNPGIMLSRRYHDGAPQPDRT